MSASMVESCVDSAELLLVRHFSICHLPSTIYHQVCSEIPNRQDGDVVFLRLSAGKTVHPVNHGLDDLAGRARGRVGEGRHQPRIRVQLIAAVDRLGDAVREEQQHVAAVERDRRLHVARVVEDAEGDATAAVQGLPDRPRPS